MVAPVRTVSGLKIITDLVKWEADPAYSRDAGVLAANNPVVIGTALGMISLGAPASAVKSSGANTGNGALTFDPTTPELANLTPGLYKVRFTDATHYRVTDPKGTVLGDSVVGTPFADRLLFNIAAGGTAFTAGDGFDITVGVGSGKLAVLNPAATDGSAKCVGFSCMQRDPGNADSTIFYSARATLLADAGIVWPVGFTSAQIAQALADVAPQGLIARPAY